MSKVLKCVAKRTLRSALKKESVSKRLTKNSLSRPIVSFMDDDLRQFKKLPLARKRRKISWTAKRHRFASGATFKMAISKLSNPICSLSNGCPRSFHSKKIGQINVKNKRNEKNIPIKTEVKALKKTELLLRSQADNQMSEQLCYQRGELQDYSKGLTSSKKVQKIEENSMTQKERDKRGQKQKQKHSKNIFQQNDILSYQEQAQKHMASKMLKKESESNVLALQAQVQYNNQMMKPQLLPQPKNDSQKQHEPQPQCYQQSQCTFQRHPNYPKKKNEQLSFLKLSHNSFSKINKKRNIFENNFVYKQRFQKRPFSDEEIYFDNDDEDKNKSQTINKNQSVQSVSESISLSEKSKRRRQQTVSPTSKAGPSLTSIPKEERSKESFSCSITERQSSSKIKQSLDKLDSVASLKFQQNQNSEKKQQLIQDEIQRESDDSISSQQIREKCKKSKKRKRKIFKKAKRQQAKIKPRIRRICRSLNAKYADVINSDIFIINKEENSSKQLEQSNAMEQRQLGLKMLKQKMGRLRAMEEWARTFDCLFDRLLIRETISQSLSSLRKNIIAQKRQERNHRRREEKQKKNRDKGKKKKNGNINYSDYSRSAPDSLNPLNSRDSSNNSSPHLPQSQYDKPQYLIQAQLPKEKDIKATNVNLSTVRQQTSLYDQHTLNNNNFCALTPLLPFQPLSSQQNGVSPNDGIEAMQMFHSEMSLYPWNKRSDEEIMQSDFEQLYRVMSEDHRIYRFHSNSELSNIDQGYGDYQEYFREEYENHDYGTDQKKSQKQKEKEKHIQMKIFQEKSQIHDEDGYGNGNGNRDGNGNWNEDGNGDIDQNQVAKSVQQTEVIQSTTKLTNKAASTISPISSADRNIGPGLFISRLKQLKNQNKLLRQQSKINNHKKLKELKQGKAPQSVAINIKDQSIKAINKFQSLVNNLD